MIEMFSVIRHGANMANARVVQISWLISGLDKARSTIYL
jgi:hypothetical protein